MVTRKTANANVCKIKVKGNHSRILLQLYNMCISLDFSLALRVIDAASVYGLM